MKRARCQLPTNDPAPYSDRRITATPLPDRWTCRHKSSHNKLAKNAIINSSPDGHFCHSSQHFQVIFMFSNSLKKNVQLVKLLSFQWGLHHSCLLQSFHLPRWEARWEKKPNWREWTETIWKPEAQVWEMDEEEAAQENNISLSHRAEQGKDGQKERMRTLYWMMIVAWVVFNSHFQLHWYCSTNPTDCFDTVAWTVWIFKSCNCQPLEAHHNEMF